VPEREIVAVKEKEAAFLNLHLEPAAPLEVSELTNALASLARQYQQFAERNGVTVKASDARLLVSNVKPGSIDINFIPDFTTIVAVAQPLIPLMWDRYELLVKFAKSLQALLNFFLGSDKDEERPLSIKDCDDVVNILRPIAQHGGHQTINIHNGPITNHILTVNVSDAQRGIEHAANKRAALQAGSVETKQRVAMVWEQLARDAPKTGGDRSPDKGLIEEIDSKPRPVFFTDDMTYLKIRMIDDEENPYRKVFFVDVEISRVPGGRVGNYRIVGYHGQDDREE